ncbi:MAG: protease HtpX [Chlamydiae bacterium]|nr:protease HtpX [Chlamydiota bacterium]
MAIAKRIFLFLAVNFLVVLTLSIILSIFNIRPYLNAYGINYPSLMIFCLVWGMGGALISLSMSRMMAKMMMGVQIISPTTKDSNLKNLVDTVYDMARAANLVHMPEVGIFQSPEPNAFATGPTKKRSLVAVSTGLLHRMSQKELEGVIAHEISHIENGDMVTMTLIQGVVNAFVMFMARALAYVVSGLGNKKDNSSSGSYAGYAILVFLFEVVFMILGSIVVASFSRFREFRADKGGATLAGREKMIAALESLRSMQGMRDPRVDKPSFESMKISSVKKSGWMALFASHPPLEDRIARLKQGI